jgi:hypothetical protein
MAELNTSAVEKEVGGVLRQLVSFIPKEYRLLIGVVLGSYLAIFLPILLISGVDFISAKAKQAKEPAKACWALQQIGEKIFKINTCTGDAVELTGGVALGPKK